MKRINIILGGTWGRSLQTILILFSPAKGTPLGCDIQWLIECQGHLVRYGNGNIL